MKKITSRKVIKKLLGIISLSLVIYLLIQFTIKFKILFPSGPQFASREVTLNSPYNYVPFSKVYSESYIPQEDDKFIIETATDLYQFSYLCATNTLYLDLDYMLGCDIKYEGAWFIPVGFQSPFTGTFDGQGFEITTLRLDQINYDNYESRYNELLRYYSMFSVIGEEGVVKNFGLINPVLLGIDGNFDILRDGSYIAGENNGEISHCYVIDIKPDADAGQIIYEDLHLAGLVSVNNEKGKMENGFIAATKLKHASSQNVLSTSLIVKENHGTITKVYLDEDVYKDKVSGDVPLSDAEVVLKSEYDIDLTTSQFQTNNLSNNLFSADWFFNNSYDGIISAENLNELRSDYPILLGLQKEKDNSAFIINEPRQLVYLREVLNSTAPFNEKTYTINSDLDMRMVARNAIVTPINEFKGILQGESISTNIAGTLYTREVDDNNYFSIIYLNVSKGVSFGAAAGYGLLGVVSGQVKTLNILNSTMKLNDLNSFLEKDYIACGLVASSLKGGTIDNVHVYLSSASIEPTTLGKTYMGGILGYGYGTIQNSSTNGNMNIGIHEYHANSIESAFGGIAGFGAFVPDYLRIDSSINSIDIIGPSFTTKNDDSFVSLGGIAGGGHINRFSGVINEGNIQSHAMNGYIKSVFMGGVVGYQLRLQANSPTITNYGDLTLSLNQPMIAKLAAGYGVTTALDLSYQTRRIVSNVKNYGELLIKYPNDVNNFTEEELKEMDIELAGVENRLGISNTRLTNVYNYADAFVDISVVHSYAGIAIANHCTDPNNTNTSPRFKYDNLSSDYAETTVEFVGLYNYGNIEVVTLNDMYYPQVKIAGCFVGKNANFDLTRNMGHINVTLSRDASEALNSAPPSDRVANQQKNLKIMGICEEVSRGRTVKNILNVGDIKVTTEENPNTNEDPIVRYNLYVSGIGYKMASRQTANTLFINNGYIHTDVKLLGNVLGSGIFNVIQNATNFKEVANTGDVLLDNECNNDTEATFMVEGAGVANLLVNPETSACNIFNLLNYGNIVAYAQGNNGIATASGIASRNSFSEELILSNLVNHLKYSIYNSINYGSIYAWSDQAESYNATDRANSVAAGILGDGHLDIRNTINYGNIYSRTLASGIIGQWDYGLFGASSNNRKRYVANLINYGKIRKMVSADAFSYDSTTNGVVHNQNAISDDVTRNGNSAYGAIIGNTLFPDQNTKFDQTYIHHWLSFDSLVDMVGTSFFDMVGTINENLPYTLSDKMYTVKENDNSNIETPIQSYELNNGANGVFNPDFPFMKPESITDDPEARNIIKFIPTPKFNSVLLEKLGFNFSPTDDTKGIFALGPSTGIVSGSIETYLPENFNLDLLNGTEGNEWQTEKQNPNQESIREKFQLGMRQLKLLLIIDYLELVDLDNPSLRLTKPIIDVEQLRIYFYVSDNAEQAADPNKTSSPLYIYLPAESGEGTHSLDNGTFVEDENGTHKRVETILFSSSSPTDFYVDTLDPTKYKLGLNTTFFEEEGNDESSYNLPATIINSYGPYYDGKIVDVNNNVRDNYTTHYGTIRVFAVDSPNLYVDYTILIIRLQEQELENFEASENQIVINGVTYDLTNYVVEEEDVDISIDITSVPLHHKKEGTLGTVKINFDTINTYYGIDPITSVRVLAEDETEVVSTWYNFVRTTVTGTGGLGSAGNGTWDPGKVNYTLEVNNTMPHGTYTLEFYYGTNKVYRMTFEKKSSNEAAITSILSTNFTITNIDGTYYTDIPYGMYFNRTNNTTMSATRILNFTMLPSDPVPKVNVNTTTYRPSYLTRLVISEFATLLSVTVEVSEELLDGYRLEYVVTYQIEAEDGTQKTYYHYIREKPVIEDINYARVDYGSGLVPITESLDYQTFSRDKTPKYYYEYNAANLYAFQSWASGTLDYNGSDEYELSAGDYQYVLQNNGFIIQFFDGAPIGEYVTGLKYENSITYDATTYGENYPLVGKTFEWEVDFISPTFVKEGNSNSRLERVSFSSESIYVSVNNIIHPEEVNSDLYENLFYYPELRLLHFLPGNIIDYGSISGSWNTFYIIGLVADTYLGEYQPNFILPSGGKIYRVSNGVESDNLKDDFNPLDDLDNFNFVHYRVYAEDYIEDHAKFGTHYTDYYIAVFDVTNNVILTIEIYNNDYTDIYIPRAFIRMNLTREGKYIQYMSLFSFFNEDTFKGSNYQFKNTSSGLYDVTAILPPGYSISISSESTKIQIIGDSFQVPNSIITRRYTIKLFIEYNQEPEWGQTETETYHP